MKLLSHVQLFATPWTVAYQAPPSMRFSWQEYWSGLPFLSPGDLPDPEIELRFPALQADSLPSEPPGKPMEGSVFIFPTSVELVFVSLFFLRSHPENFALFNLSLFQT